MALWRGESMETKNSEAGKRVGTNGTVFSVYNTELGAVARLHTAQACLFTRRAERRLSILTLFR